MAKTKWLVQARNSRKAKWKREGVFVARSHARAMAAQLRDGWASKLVSPLGVGRGNTRVLRLIGGKVVPYVRVSA